MDFKGLTIGIPREIMDHEQRVAAMPETVKKLVAEGARVIIEKDAGAGSFFTDSMYREAGAEIVEDPEKIYQTSDILMKVKEPIFNKDKNKSEVSMMKKGMVLVSFLHPASPVNHQMVQDLARQGVIGLTLDGIPRITKAQPMDALPLVRRPVGDGLFVLDPEPQPEKTPLQAENPPRLVADPGEDRLGRVEQDPRPGRETPIPRPKTAPLRITTP